MFLVNSSGDFFIRESLYIYIYISRVQRTTTQRNLSPAAVLFDVYAGKEKTKKTKKKCITSHLRDNNINERKS